MVTHEQKRRLGIFLFLSLIATIITLALLLGPKLREKGDEYLVRFRGVSVNGLNVGGSVKYQGVEIGRVTEISVDPEDLNAILVRIKVRARFPMKENMEVKLQFLGITGIRYLEISGGTNNAQRLKKGSELSIGRGLSEQAEDVVSNIDEAVKNLTTLLRTDNLEKIDRFLSNLEKSSKILTDTLGENKADFAATLENLAVTSQQLHLVAQNLLAVSGSVREGLQTVPLSELLGKTDTVMEKMEQRLSDQELGMTVNRINSVLETADLTIKKIGNLFVSQQKEISLALISLRKATDNISQLSRDLSEEPSNLIRPRKETRRRK